MAKKIFKYDLTTHGYIDLVMPAGAEIQSVAPQGEVPKLWALVDDRQTATERRSFYVAATGEELPDFRRYLGTALLAGGAYVVHILELPR